MPEICRQLGITDGCVLPMAQGMRRGWRVTQAKRLKELEHENSRRKRLLADAELDKAILLPEAVPFGSVAAFFMSPKKHLPVC